MIQAQSAQTAKNQAPQPPINLQEFSIGRRKEKVSFCKAIPHLVGGDLTPEEQTQRIEKAPAESRRNQKSNSTAPKKEKKRYKPFMSPGLSLAISAFNGLNFVLLSQMSSSHWLGKACALTASLCYLFSGVAGLIAQGLEEKSHKVEKKKLPTD